MSRSAGRPVPRVWLADLRHPAAPSDGVLDERERARAATYLGAGDREAFARGRSFLRSVLARELGIEAAAVRFVIDERGRPELAGAPPPFRFSFARSRHMAACAIWDGVVGMDLEVVAPVPEWRTIAEGFSVDERAAVERSEDPPARGFLEAWTRREALVKAAGVGLVGGSDATIRASDADAWVGRCAGAVFQIRTPALADASIVISVAAKRAFEMPSVVACGRGADGLAGAYVGGSP